MLIKNTSDEILPYLTDASNFTGKSNQVAIPESQAELIDIFNNYISKGKCVTISGAGTGLTGSRVPLEGSVISLEKLNTIINFDVNNNTLTVEPGVTIKEIQNYLIDYNLFYPPNPTEINSTIGGNIATNASGSRTFKYGSTRDYILRLKLLLPNGSIADIRRGQYFVKNDFASIYSEKEKIDLVVPFIQMPLVKHAAGYYIKKDMDLIDLFIGAEGTLGIVLEADLKVISQPDNVISMFIFFDNDNNILSMINEMQTMEEFSSVRLIEYYDRNSLDFMELQNRDIPKNAVSALWIEDEQADDPEILEMWLNQIQNYTNLPDETWFANDEKTKRDFYEFRHSLPLHVNEYLVGNNLQKIGTDTAVPFEGIKKYFFFLKSELEKLDLKYYLFGHIGNNHLHANIFAKNDNEIARAKDFYSRLIDYVIETGGTVSAEHGIGKTKKEYLLRLFGYEGIEKMKKIKRRLDPDFLLNRYNLFDPD